MSQTGATTGKRRDWAMFLPPAAIVALYALVMFFWGLPGGATLAKLRQDLVAAQAAAVSPERLAATVARRDALQQQTAELRKKLVAERQEAESLGRREGGGKSGVAAHQQTNRVLSVFEKHGLHVANDQAVTQAGQDGMAASLQSATRGLLSALADSQEKKAPTGPLSPQAIAALIEEQQEQRARGTQDAPQTNVVVPPLQLRELEVHGGYLPMLAALRELSQNGSPSGVISLSLKRQARAGGQSPDVIWRLVLHVQPAAQRAAEDTDRLVDGR